MLVMSQVGCGGGSGDSAARQPPHRYNNPHRGQGFPYLILLPTNNCRLSSLFYVLQELFAITIREMLPLRQTGMLF